VSVIIVNYNGQRFVEDCLRSLISQTRSPDEIVVVDNASTDDSVQMIVNSFPQIKVVILDHNLGFPAACNRGIKETNSELIAILNNDVVLDEKWLESLLKQVAPSWGFWASRIVFAADPDRIDSAGDGMAVVGAAYKIGHGDPASKHTHLKEVFGPCAAAALYRRSMLELLNGFDEDFFLIYEDADLNMRARLRGFRCLYVPDAVVRHMVNTSIGRFSHNYVFYGHRNSEYLFWKNMPSLLLWLYLPERILFDLLSLFYFAWQGKGITFLKAKADFLRHYSATLKKRREIQRRRILANRELRGLLDRNWLKYRRNVAVQS
jgi:GT2 family glycosyltransferase